MDHSHPTHEDTIQSEMTGTSTSLPWDKVVFAPAATWIADEPYDANIPPKTGDHITQLLWSRQIEAGSGRSFHATARRLETSLAVQHESQWSIQFDPRTQILTLHWLRIVRAGQSIDHLRQDRMRLIQRETNLERLIMDGVWTLVTVLDDVRPGDIIEAGYSYATEHPICPRLTEAFFIVPPNLVVGRYRLSVLSEKNPMPFSWKTSPDASPVREETLPEGGYRWTWEGSQLAPREPEQNQPGTSLDYTWIQVSDLNDWSRLTTQVAEAWEAKGDSSWISNIPAFSRPETIDAPSVNQLIAFIQDEFRYLSMDLEHGGWIPSTPSEIIKRRYGDCKDLAWLATNILRSWGLYARPILVGTGLREMIAELLPMRSVFNHAVLEVRVDGKTRWFDLTERQQGGTFETRSIAWFGRGLPVDSTANDICEQPGAPVPGVYSLKETILLDTRRGAPSLVEIRLCAEGWQADNLRNTRHARGVDEFAKERDANMVRRYKKAKRTGSMEWRDNRVLNKCELVEVFETFDIVYPDESGRRALFDVPVNLVPSSIPLPDNKPRRTPWAMPFPLSIRHEINVRAGSMAAGKHENRRWQDSFFIAFLDEPRLRGSWSKTAIFTTKTPYIPADQVGSHRRELEKFLLEIGWRIYLPWRQPRGHRSHDFGVLAESKPSSEDRSFQHEPHSGDASDLKIAAGQRRRRRSYQNENRTFSVNISRWAWSFAWFLFVSVALGLFRGCTSGHGY